MHDNAWACYVQNKLHHGQKPNPNYYTHIVKSSTQPRMHESMIIMLENAMHEHVRTNQQNPTQKFHRKLKNPKFFPKRENLGLKCLKCMKKEKKMRFRTRTKRMRLGLGWNLEWKRFLVKRKGLDWERRERDRDIWVWAKLGRTSDIYRKTQLNKSRNKNSIDREISRRYQWQKILDKSRRYRVDRDSKELTRWIELSIERYRKKKKPKNLDRRDLYRGAIELLSRRYRASIEKLETRFFNEEKQQKMNAIKIDTKTSNQEAC